MNSVSKWLVWGICLLVLAGCAGADPTAILLTATAVPLSTTSAALPTPALPDTIYVGFVLENVGFDTPESIRYDSEADVYLVANINGSPGSKDGNGFISRVSPDGAMLTLKWIDGEASGVTLNAPKGMALSGSELFIADIDAVRVFDRASGQPVIDIAVPGAVFLNDIAAGEDGVVYVTDSSTGAIYRLRPDRAVEQVASFAGANGIDVRNGAVWFVAQQSVYKLGADGQATQEYALPNGGLDGLTVLQDEMLVSSWSGSAIYRIDPEGIVSELLSGIQAPADIGFDSKRNYVLVPWFQDSKIVAYPR